MRSRLLPLLALLPALAVAAVPAPVAPGVAAQSPASPQIMLDVKAGRWNDALALAEATGDPLMVKLVTYFQLTQPGGGAADDIQAFIDANPDWPTPGLLALRLAEAGGAANTTAAPIPPPFLAQVEALHAAGNDDAAAALWVSQGGAAAAAADDPTRLLFWPDQNELARDLLMQGNPKEAYAVVTAAAPPAGLTATARSEIGDRDFLAGFLLLRFLKQPEAARQWFVRLADASTAVITQARAYYWIARTETGAPAAADYARAAAYPDTYYGQLAGLALGDSPAALAARITAAGEPPFTAAGALHFAVMVLPRAAALLVPMGGSQAAQPVLARLGQTAGDTRTRELAARLALGLGLPQSAVSIARTAGIAGQMLVREGWPMPVTPPAGTVEPAIAYGIMRQESSFDPTAISGAGAAGLMQLMPDTARRTAAQNAIPYRGQLMDPVTNMALGTAYIAGLIQNFNNCLPLAIAAYNAGPTNVANWLAANGDPQIGKGLGGADLIDWIEEIPFNETRNYVQRVTESIVVYRALLTGTAASPLQPWLSS